MKGTERARPNFVFRGHTASVNSVSFFADDRFFVSGDQNGTLIVWNMLLKKLFLSEPAAHSGAILAVRGVGTDMVISQGRDNKLKIWKMDAGEFEGTLVCTKSLDIKSAGFCQFTCTQYDNDTCIAGLSDLGTGKAFLYLVGQDRVIEIDIKRRAMTRSGPREDPPMCLRLVSKNSAFLILVVGYESTELSLFRVNPDPNIKDASVCLLTKTTGHSEPLMSIDCDTQRNRIYTCAADNKVCCYSYINLRTLKEDTEPATLKHNGSACIRYFFDLSVVVVAGWDYIIHIFDAELNKIRNLVFHRGAITSVDMSTMSDGYTKTLADNSIKARWAKRPRWLVVASRDARISLWEIDAYAKQ